MRAVKPLIQNALSRPLLQTTIGNMLGTQLHVSDGQQVSAYFSIPFAEPPIGRLRFEVTLLNNQHSTFIS
jgi:carboxylesterase type B